MKKAWTWIVGMDFRTKWWLIILTSVLNILMWLANIALDDSRRMEGEALPVLEPANFAPHTIFDT